MMMIIMINVYGVHTTLFLTCYIVVMGIDSLYSLGSRCVDTVVYQCVSPSMEQVIIRVMQAFQIQSTQAYLPLEQH